MKTNIGTNLKTRKPVSGISSILVIAVVVIAAVILASIFFSGYMGSGSGASYSPPSLYGNPGHSTTSVRSMGSNQGTTSTIAGGSSSNSMSGAVNVAIVSGAHLQSQSQHFVPDTITVVIGRNNTVTWKNEDNSIHTVTADNGAFNSGIVNPGSSFTFTFTTPGTFAYHCSIHPFMTGKIIVLPAA
jgi:plastocyanin